eukprot:scaffold7363_cov263-Pinguiococcus_pyrenoidosus.AAC.1
MTEASEICHNELVPQTVVVQQPLLQVEDERSCQPDPKAGWYVPENLPRHGEELGESPRRVNEPGRKAS